MTTTTTTTTTTTHTTTTVPLKTGQNLYFGGEDTQPELQWYPMKHEKVIELQSYNQEPLSWKDAEILPSPEPLTLFQNTVSPENIIDLTSTLKSGLCNLFHRILLIWYLVVGQVFCEFSFQNKTLKRRRQIDRSLSLFLSDPFHLQDSKLIFFVVRL